MRAEGDAISALPRDRGGAGCPNAAFGQVPGDCARLHASPGEPDVAVRTQQVKRLPGDSHPSELQRVVRVLGNRMTAQQVAESRCFLQWRGLPDDDEVVARVVQLLEQVFDRAVRPELELQPRET